MKKLYAAVVSLAALAAFGAEKQSYLMVYHKDADHSLHMGA